MVGDFNIHVCCVSKPLVKDFLNILDSFNLTQSVNSPTHNKGHVLDLVLSYGLNLSITDISDACISDHMPVLFTVSLPCSQSKTDLLCVSSAQLIPPRPHYLLRRLTPLQQCP